MRLLITLDDQKQAYALSAYLTKEGYENKLDHVPNTDWSSPDYGSVSCSLWVIDEDHFDEAKKIAEEFAANPTDSRYYGSERPAAPRPRPAIKAPLKAAPQKSIPQREPLGKLTSFLLILCTVILFFSKFSMPELEKMPPENLPMTPFFMPPIYKDLMFDYPYAYEILDKVINAYGAKSLDNPTDLPPEGQLLLKQFYNTPYWKGFYDVAMNAHLHGAPFAVDAPLFEKEHQGEMWRLLTPCLLHGGILHLLFNMLWLALLGRQMESRLGMGRYALFIVTVGIISNVAQYLMGGANFLGFSGVLCGMLAFIWVRRRQAAWEGYQLQPGTLGFITFFILLMFAIQLATFIAQYFFGIILSPAIANTAHLTGALCGYLLGKTKFFAWKMS